MKTLKRLLASALLAASGIASAQMNQPIYVPVYDSSSQVTGCASAHIQIFYSNSTYIIPALPIGGSAQFSQYGVWCSVGGWLYVSGNENEVYIYP